MIVHAWIGCDRQAATSVSCNDCGVLLWSQMLSSVSPGVELHDTMIGLLRSIFTGSRKHESDEGGFLSHMQRLTGAMAIALACE